MHKIVMSMVAALTISWGISSAETLHAAPLLPSFETGEYITSDVSQGIELAQYRRDRNRSYDRRRYHRPSPRYIPRPHYRQRCWIEGRREWTGRRWVRRNVRICR